VRGNPFERPYPLTPTLSQRGEGADRVCRQFIASHTPADVSDGRPGSSQWNLTIHSTSPCRQAEAWAVLMDIPRIAPCMPGAKLTKVVDHKTYKGKIAVRLGPVALNSRVRSCRGTRQFEFSRRASKAQGTDAKGVAARMRPRRSTGARVQWIESPCAHRFVAVGSVAQYGRGVGMIQAT